MAVTATGISETPTISRERKGSNAPRRGDGNFPRPPNGNGGGGHDDSRLSFDSYRVGVLVALGSITMMFTALASAYVVRSGISNDWRPMAAPSLVWVSTALILASSFVIEAARRSLRAGDTAKHRKLLFVTLLLGVSFVAAQLLAWRQLVAQGVYVSSNPHSSFFYVLTGMHGLHILGGILALTYVLLRPMLRRRAEAASEVKNQRITDAVSLYWHFMDGLWIFLFLLLFLWR